MAIGDTTNPNLFGTQNNKQEGEDNAELAAQNAMMGAGGMPESALGQAPAVTPFSMEAAGQVNPMMQEQSLAVNPQALAELPVETNANVNAKAISMADANNPAFEGMSAPEIISAVNAPDYQTPADDPSFMSKVGSFLFPYGVGGANRPTPGLSQGETTFGSTPSVTPSVESLPEGAQGQVATLDPTSDAAILANRARREAQFSEQGAPAAPGAIPPLQTFVGPSGTGYQKAPEGMVKAMGPDGKMVFTTPEQADQMNQSYLSELNASKQAQKDFLSSNVGQNEMTLQGIRNAYAQEQQANGGQAAQRPNLPGFNAGQNTQGSINNPSFDAGQGGQGRLKVQTVPQSSDFFQRGPTPSSDFFQRGPTPQGSLTDFGGITDIGGITDLRSMSASDDSKKMSYSDAKIRARGEFAARNIDPSPSQLRALTKSIQAAEPERLAGLKTERALNEARLQTAQAEQNKPEFRGRVYTVDGVTFAQLSNGSAQVISTGTEDPEKTTRDAEKFEFTKKKIEDARKAYEEGDLTKSNDILAAANIQQYGIQANATQYFADSTPQVTPPAPQVTGSGLTQQQEARINLVMGTNPTRSRAEVIEAMQTQGKL